MWFSILSGPLYLAARLPDPPDALSQTNIVRLKLVPAPANDEDGEKVEPLNHIAPERHSPFREIIGDD